MIFFIIIYVALPIITLWLIFEKAGQHGWSALVPVHNGVKLLEATGKPGWWIFLYSVPILNIIIHIKMLNGLSKSFGHGVGFTLGLIFFPFIFFPIIAFSGNQYQKPITDPNSSDF